MLSLVAGPGDRYRPWGQPLENSPLVKPAAVSCFRGHLLPLTSLASLVPWGTIKPDDTHAPQRGQRFYQADSWTKSSAEAKI